MGVSGIRICGRGKADYAGIRNVCWERNRRVKEVAGVLARASGRIQKLTLIRKGKALRGAGFGGVDKEFNLGHLDEVPFRYVSGDAIYAVRWISLELQGEV